MPASPTLDHFAVGNKSGGGSMTIAALTVTNPNTIIVVSVFNELNAGAAAVSSVTATGLTFVQRVRSNGSGNGSCEIWWALMAGSGSTTITVNFAATYDDASCVAFGVVGCNTTSPWDANVALPRKASFTANNSTMSVSGVNTSSADDLLLAFAGGVSGTIVDPTGWTHIAATQNSGGGLFSFVTDASKSVSATQSALTVTANGVVQNSGAVTAGGEFIVDALTADAPAGAGGGLLFRGVGSIAFPSPGLVAALAGARAILRNKPTTRRGLLRPWQ